MSIMNDITVTCPSCEEQITVTLAESVNADRRPDLRQDIIEGTFQVAACSSCGTEFMLDPVLNYLDMARGQWFSVQPAQRLGDWVALEDEARATFDLAYGGQASAQAREIGDGLSPRLVFGWPALREKLLIGDAELDDSIVELTKLAMIHGLPGAPIQAGVEMRLVDMQDDGGLVFQWADMFSGDVLETLVAPRALYDSIVETPEAWAEMKTSVEDGLFVDIQKLFVGEGRAAG
ncbi:MAG: CpXC domain-containing protein [Leisingera sp.]